MFKTLQKSGRKFKVFWSQMFLIFFSKQFETMNTTDLSFFIPSSSIGSAAQTLLGIHTLINF
ncbi:hypothetical protein LEP1GSC103_2208 [Leptospira borgpetersenii serovar Javanica str. UI 09931]|uniref:Uncharacterized protein n=4 Tax=Leptospira borgpetersenii TaxID=174 RepID=M3F8S7_LEPBO|nr:hypothetical protein LEP1GSC128_3946 [Leptospira borgpetersenii str. 200801926]EKQ93985.1 hypothetical protein LEP1GSC101_1710 [Leptospira borgpetersenii str. UI 09149]EMF98327.1 hypothetical protein LEP1GSC123_1725 [Leptospira borgpetersenii str. 200701203]EMK11603.1 hypothetical protein LEP1GSC066_2110 [Leptospira sp. serovar Kenya str. Sh9]EMN11302.1 hypothetical protein LEP1GSC055_0057 [Leptospira borgpetersenii str. Brem 307]EMN57540.1 hypothetical protein LEP1GSC090_2304 [Leptospira b